MPVDDEQEELPEAVVEAGRRIPAIWLVPLVAALIAGLLMWRSFQDRGPLISVTFESAAGIEAGRTTLRFRSVVVGVVEAVRVSEDLSHVVVSARLHRDSDSFRVKGTRFWVDRPRLGPEGISGLGTLVSGAFIGVDPGVGGGKEVERFRGLEQAPVNLRTEKGLRVSVHTRDFGAGLSYGAPVLYEGIQVGRVTALELDSDQSEVVAQIFVRAQYANFVRGNSRFWNASGVHFDASMRGVHAAMDSLESVLLGGLAFSTPGEPGPTAEPGSHFQLYRNARQARRDYRESLGLHVFLEAPRLGFLSPGDPVLYRGEKVGQVLGRALQDDARRVGVRIQINPRYVPLVRSDSVFWNASGVQADLSLSGFHIHVASVESLLEGSVSFSTPDPPGPRADPDSVFPLHRQVKERWLSWAPRIPVGAAPMSLPAGARENATPAAPVDGEGMSPQPRASGEPAAVHGAPDTPQPAEKDPSSQRHLFEGAHHGMP